MVGLRSAAVSDAAVVARIYVDSWNDGFGHLLGVRGLTPDLVTRWRNDLADEHVDWIIAESEGKIVGFVGVRASRDPAELFRPFYRAAARTGNGHGLGLAIVRSVALAHGGPCAATPRPEGGLAVTVWLPRHAEGSSP